MRDYAFKERLVMSQGVSEADSVGDILLREIPGAGSVDKADIADDLNGTDWWVSMRSGNRISVDVKVRSHDCVSAYGSDDLALETWSVVGSKIGWTRDLDKRTDFILWLWQDTGRWCLLPFPMLSRVFMENYEQWTARYKKRTQRSTSGRRTWKSECVFVPRKVVWQEIYRRFSGCPTLQLAAA